MQVLRMIYKMLITAVIIMFMPVKAAFVLWLQELQNRYLVIPEKKLEKTQLFSAFICLTKAE